MNVADFLINNYPLDADVNVFIRVVDKNKRVKQKISKHNKATRNMTEGIIRFLRGEFNTTFLREFKDTITNIGDNSEIARYFIPTHMGIGNIGIDLNTGEIPSGLVEFDHVLDPSYSDTNLRSEILPEHDPHRVKIQKSIKSEATLSDTYVLDVQGYYQFNQITNSNNHPFKFIYANTLKDNPPTEVIEFTDPETGLSCITITELGLYSGDIDDNGSRLLARLLLSPLTPLIISQDDTVIINWQIGLKSLNEMILYNREYYDYQYQNISVPEPVYPTGNIDITTLNIIDVTNYATAQVVDANIIPANIKKDVTILGVTGTHEGGDQPRLFAPNIIGGVNNIAWENNSANGDFPVTITADVDGTTVTSPLTITEEMDGSTLTITASATNFQSVTTPIILSYIQTSNSLLAVDISGRAQYASEYMSIGSDGNASVGKFVLDGNEATKGSALITARGQVANETITSNFCFVATANGTIDFRSYYAKGIQYYPCQFMLDRKVYNDDTLQFNNQISASVSIYDVTADEMVGSWNVTGRGGISSTRITWLTVEANHVYTFIINATITAL